MFFGCVDFKDFILVFRIGILKKRRRSRSCYGYGGFNIC